MPQINTEESWNKIAHQFYSKWNIPNCVGAVDGKHVSVFCPKKSGSLYFNYKGTFSIVLMAVVDADYKYIMTDIGAYGHNSDGGIFSHSNFGKLWLTDNRSTLNVPELKKLPGTEISVPLVLIGDEAFPLKENILRPFPGKNLSERERITNYRISRARRVVENAFGITVHKWRVLLKKIEVNAAFATSITLACCILHNFLIVEKKETPYDISETTETHTTISENQQLHTVRYNRPTKRAMDVRNHFADWFISPAGEVPWQYEYINK